jgi:hypothetical protein
MIYGIIAMNDIGSDVFVARSKQVYIEWSEATVLSI